MSLPRLHFSILIIFLLTSVGCHPVSRASIPKPVAVTPSSLPSPHPTRQWTQPPTNEATPTAATATLAPSPLSLTKTPSPTPLPCGEAYCVYQGHFLLQRPISSDFRDIIDPTYRYGSTQDGQRETHHGVEFVNSTGTPVLAAAEGEVIVAGDDFNARYADYPAFYGNVVIIEHHFSMLNKPLYTLYAHLSRVAVEVGQLVKPGDIIGYVGATGTAIGSHLHFEVRFGENDYQHTRNPELWLIPKIGENSQPYGVLAGKILDEYGNPIYVPTVVLEQLAQDGTTIRKYYLETYADASVHSDDEWQENFVIGDLSPGPYRLKFVARGLQVHNIDIFPGMVTLYTFDANRQNDE